MTTARIQKSTSNDTLFISLGVLAGIVVMLFGYWLWQDYAGNAGHSLLAAASQVIAGAFPTSIRGALAEQARIMGLPLLQDSQAYWFIARSGGILAYLLLWFATAWGIMMSSKIMNDVVGAPLAYGFHEFFPILAMVFAAVHVLVLLGDSYIGFNFFDLIVPFSSSYEPLWTGLGTLSLLLSTALIASFYIRKRIGRKAWRAFHYLSYLSFLLALVHGLMAGTDSSHPAIQAMYWLTGASLLFLTTYRVLMVRRS